MQLKQENIDKLLQMLSNPKARLVLKIITDGRAYKYSTMKNEYNKIHNQAKSNVFSHYIRKLVINGLVKKDKKTQSYFLTRVGVQALHMIENFEKLCMEYDISDLDADGKVMTVVVNRKL
jgi:predicted transcriptional regulator